MIDLNTVREIDAADFISLLEINPKDYLLIDVREKDERDICTLNGIHIPVGEINNRLNEIPRDRKVIFHCKSGKRGEMVILFLQQNHKFENLYNLKGGINAMAEIHPNIELY